MKEETYYLIQADIDKLDDEGEIQIISADNRVIILKKEAEDVGLCGNDNEYYRDQDGSVSLA